MQGDPGDMFCGLLNSQYIEDHHMIPGPHWKHHVRFLLSGNHICKGLSGKPHEVSIQILRVESSHFGVHQENASSGAYMAGS